MKHVNLRQLEIFRTVMETGSITKAAEQLNVTQPAVSRALSAFEEELGFELFHRGRGRAQPSTDAELLLSEVERLFQQVESLRDSAERVQYAQQGRLSVAAVPSLAGSFIGFAAAAFQQKRPRVGFEIFSRISGQVVEDVTHHRVDLGFIHGPADDTGVDQWIVGESEIVCIMHRDHPLVERDVLTPRDLAEYPLAFLDKHAPPSHLVREAFATSGYKPRVVVEANLSAAAKATASSGNIVALTEPLTLLNDPQKLAVRSFRPRIPIRIYAIASTQRPLSHAARTMADEVVLSIQNYARHHPYIHALDP